MSWPRNRGGTSMLGPSTDVINGQLTFIREREYIWPRAYGPMRQAVPSVTPTVPPVFGNDLGMINAQPALDHPWSLMSSPLPWAIIMLVVGLLGLRFIHWRPMG